MALTDKLTAIADAIRTKTGTTDAMILDDMPNMIEMIQGGGGGNYFDWGGRNAELVASYSEDWTLADTSFVVGTSASTTATSIKSSTPARFTSDTINFGDKDIIVLQRLEVNPTHEGATGKVQCYRSAGIYLSTIAKRKANPTSAKTSRQVMNQNLTILEYANSSGTILRNPLAYGFYGTMYAPNLTSSTAASTTIKIASPVLYYRCSSSYESTTNVKKVTECVWKWRVEVYTLDFESTTTNKIGEEIDSILMNGI